MYLAEELGILYQTFLNLMMLHQSGYSTLLAAKIGELREDMWSIQQVTH